MVNGIVTVFVVLAIFSVVASLLTLYVWRADPYQFAIWKAGRPGRVDAAIRELSLARRPETASEEFRRLAARSRQRARRTCRDAAGHHFREVGSRAVGVLARAGVLIRDKHLCLCHELALG